MRILVIGVKSGLPMLLRPRILKSDRITVALTDKEFARGSCA